MAGRGSSLSIGSHHLARLTADSRNRIRADQRSRQQAAAAQLLKWWRDHWGIENRVHYVRDVTFGEDHCRVRTGSAPQVLAACRNAAISFLRSHNCPNIAAALREHAYQPRKLFAKLGILKQ